MFKGNPTKYLKGVAMKAKRGAQHLEKQKSEDNEISNCNSKWSQTVVWTFMVFKVSLSYWRSKLCIIFFVIETTQGVIQLT
jgi:hypothetical protein